MTEEEGGGVEKVLRKSAEETIKKVLQIYKGLKLKTTTMEAGRVVFTTEKSFAHRLEKQFSDKAKSKFTFLFERKNGKKKIKICSIRGEDALLMFVATLHSVLEATSTPDKKCAKIKEELWPVIKKCLGEKAVCRCKYSKEYGFRVFIGIKGIKCNVFYYDNNHKHIILYVLERITEIIHFFETKK